MAPSPRVTVEKDIWDLENQRLGSFADEDEDAVTALDPDTRGYRYYESQNVLGKLYRAIDERNFLAELQERGRRPDRAEPSGDSLIHRLWAYVKVQIHLVQWEHHLKWARDVKEE
jgi:hypothetical protein